MYASNISVEMRSKVQGFYVVGRRVIEFRRLQVEFVCANCKFCVGDFNIRSREHRITVFKFVKDVSNVNNEINGYFILETLIISQAAILNL